MSLLNLLEGVRVVVRCNWDVPAVEDFAPEVERIGFEWSCMLSADDSHGGGRISAHTHCTRR